MRADPSQQKKKGGVPRTASRRESECERAGGRAGGREYASGERVLIQPSYPAFSFEISQLRNPSFPLPAASLCLHCYPTARKSIGIRRSNGFAEGIKDEAGTALRR